MVFTFRVIMAIIMESYYKAMDSPITGKLSYDMGRYTGNGFHE